MRLAATLALSVVSAGCVVYPRTVKTQHVVPEHSSQLVESGDVELETRVAGDHIEVVATRPRQCVSQYAQTIETVTGAEVGVVAVDVDVDDPYQLGAYIVLSPLISIPSLVITALVLATGDDKVERERVVLERKRVDCSRPVTGAVVSLGGAAGVRTDSDGRAQLPIPSDEPDGPWELRVAGLPTGRAERTLTLWTGRGRIRTQVHALAPSLHRCGRETLAPDGRRIHFVVAGGRAELVHDDGAEPDFEECVQDILRRVRIPTPHRRETVSFFVRAGA